MGQALITPTGMRYVDSPTNGDILITNSNGQAIDSGTTPIY